MPGELDFEGVRTKLAGFSGSLQVVFHAAHHEASTAASELAELARRIADAAGGGVRVQRGDGAGLLALPALTIAHRGCGRIHYYSPPEGSEASPFLEALLGPEHGSSALFESRVQALAGLERPAELLVFVASTCPHCPNAARAANHVALAAPRVTTSIVDVQRHAALAERFKARAVPLTVVDGSLSLTGVVPATDLVEHLLARGSDEYELRAFRSLIEYGRFAEAAEQIAAGPGAAHFLAAWAESDTPLRIGLMMTVEEILARDRTALDGTVPGLLLNLRSQDAGLRGDTADLLGRIGRAEAAKALRSLLADPNPDVAEIASEALEEISERNA